jgi:hypothetical protein
LVRARAANQWEDSGLVFTTELGGPVDPRSLLRMIAVAAKSVGVEEVGGHTLLWWTGNSMTSSIWTQTIPSPL